MAKLAWGLSGQRYFESGTDRGVLYVGTTPGVPWNGLISVSENPSGGDPVPYYMDGIKYLNVAAAEEFEATISAFSSPDEFGVCDGTALLSNGLFATQQPRKPFDLTYRTLIGNDEDGIEHGYKLHLVYNALAKPTTRENKTLERSVTPANFDWDISTLPIPVPGYKPTAHFIIDSRQSSKLLMDQIESILYGSAITDPRMPSISEILVMFASYAELEVMVKYDTGLFGVAMLPTIISSIVPALPQGVSSLWLDKSQGTYSTLKQVIGD